MMMMMMMMMMMKSTKTLSIKKMPSEDFVHKAANKQLSQAIQLKT